MPGKKHERQNWKAYQRHLVFLHQHQNPILLDYWSLLCNMFCVVFVDTRRLIYRDKRFEKLFYCHPSTRFQTAYRIDWIFTISAAIEISVLILMCEYHLNTIKELSPIIFISIRSTSLCFKWCGKKRKHVKTETMMSQKSHPKNSWNNFTVAFI